MGSPPRPEQEVITEFLGTTGSKQVHGLVRTIASTGGGATSGVLRIALATPPLWDSLNGALIWDTFSIEHDFTQDLAAIQQQQEQLAGFSQQVGGFDQALTSTDLVEDPATGQEFEAPYTAYSQSGPDGPSYYTGSPGTRPSSRSSRRSEASRSAHAPAPRTAAPAPWRDRRWLRPLGRSRPEPSRGRLLRSCLTR